MTKNYRNSGEMVGQAFNCSGKTDTDHQNVCMMLCKDSDRWIPIPEMTIESARKKYPEAKIFKALYLHHDKNFSGN